MTSDRPATASLEELYAGANAAYHDGREEVAERGFRQVLHREPSHQRARDKLSALRVRAGRSALETGAIETALGALREAVALRSDDARYRGHLKRALGIAVRHAIGSGDAEVASALLTEAATLGNDERMNVLHRRLGSLASMPALSSYRPPPPGTEHERDLVIVENGVDVDLLGGYLLKIEQADAFAERRLPHLGSEEPGRGTSVASLMDVGTLGLQADFELCRETDQLAARVRAALTAAVPARRRTVERLDVLEHLSFEVDDKLFIVGKKVNAIEELFTSGRFRRVVFVLGDGRLHRCVLDSAVKRFGSGGVLFFWCSEALDRFDSVVRDYSEHHAQVGDSAGRLAAQDPWSVKSVGSNVHSAVKRAGVRRPRRAKERPVAVLTSPDPQHVGNVAPIVAELLPHAPVVAVAPYPARRYYAAFGAYEELLEAHPGRFRIYKDFRPEGVGPRTRWISDAYHRLTHTPALRDLDFHGALLWPSVHSSVESLVLRRLPELMGFTRQFEDFLRRERPRAVVLAPDRVAHSRVAASLARRHGIPTVFPQVGFFSRSPRYKPLQTDYIAVMDQFTRSLYQEHFGAPDGQILVTGIPRFDEILQRRTGSHGGPTAADGPNTVLLILQRFSLEDSEQLITMIGDVVSELVDTRLVVKMHPGDASSNREHYARMLARYNRPEFIVAPGYGLYDLIAVADVVVTVFSTVVIEAAMFERLVLCANLTGAPLPIPFAEEGAAVEATSRAEVAELLPRLLFDPAHREAARKRQDEYLQLNHHLLAGPAAVRIADEVLRLAR